MRTIIVCLAAFLFLSGCQREETASAIAPTDAAPEFKAVATVKQIMQAITIPASNAVFAVAGQAPADNAAWQSVEASALAVAESGNLLLMKPRAVDETEWRQHARALIDVGQRAAEAARAQDAEKTALAGDDMYNVCEQCHAKYLPKPSTG